MLKQSDWHPLNPLSTQHQQGKAIFRILVIFAHLCTAMGDPSTPYLNFSGLEDCSGDNFLSFNLKKSDWYPLKPLPTNHKQGNAIFRISVIFAHLCTAMGDPSTPYLNFYDLKHCSGDSLRSMLKKSDWHPMKPLSTHHQQGNAIFRVLVVFAHLCTAMGDPLTTNLKFYGLKHCSGDSFLRSMLMKSD